REYSPSSRQQRGGSERSCSARNTWLSERLAVSGHVSENSMVKKGYLAQQDTSGLARL
ncbi:hypothetical protein L195_g061492, partial [Trifolium pratense]